MKMNGTSRSGLIPTPKRNFKPSKRHKTGENGLPTKFEAMPMALSLRPLGGIINPFAKGCSVLCNHPAPTGVKELISQFKSSLTIDSKSVRLIKEDTPINDVDSIPEDLVRRYTDTDSRPLTPSPTITSARTRTSAASSFVNSRRCFTPEWGKTEQNHRKKLILDLRRSHSQETLYWKPSSDISQSDSGVNNKSKSAGVAEDKRNKRQKSEEQRPKSVAGIIGHEATEDFKCIQTPKTCINEHVLEDEDIRRGKKRKKLKPAPPTTTFHLSEDPETQMATLGPDSMNPSTRPSLIPTTVNLLPNKEKRDSEPILLKGSFLTDGAFQALKTELDIDVIESTFSRYLHRARCEAIKYIQPKSKGQPKKVEELQLTFLQQPNMPRKLSKSATRFDVPLNLDALQDMSVLDYLSKYVWVSRQRKQLYKRVFLKHLKEVEQIETIPIAADEDAETPLMEYVERTMIVGSLSVALEDVLGFYGNEANISELLQLLDCEKYHCSEMNFRTWCGIVSFAERLALVDPTCTDSCDELEEADFSSLEQRLGQLNISEQLRRVFDVIQSAHLSYH